jgi:hypothetical protein
MRLPHFTILPLPESEFVFGRFFGLPAGAAVAVGVAVAVAVAVALAVAVGAGVATVVFTGEGKGVGVEVVVGAAVGELVGASVGAAVAAGAGEVTGVAVASTVGSGDGSGAWAGVARPRTAANIAATTTPTARMRPTFTREKMERMAVTTKKAEVPDPQFVGTAGVCLEFRAWGHGPTLPNSTST